ncbi:hypothetical protein L208DRAFT_1274536 [Tricholoma matsutake]|nr:hypothetical protein L208DRAFT_1274536 [Tricholoma matsutake 945]
MGYWSPKTCEGFLCLTPGSTHNGIFFFEALSVLSAFFHVCKHSAPKPSQLAILTNNSNTFDMFNSLHALLAYNPILITAVNFMITSGIQLHIFHIPYSENQVADTLSWLDNTTAHMLHPGLSV